MAFVKCIFKILLIFLICFLKFVACEYNQTDEFMQMLSIKTRIAGGYRPNYQPLAKYIVSLRSTSETKDRFGCSHFCAGSIIASNIILTAAHCVYRYRKFSVPPIKIAAKTPIRLSQSLSSQEAGVIKVIVHPAYKDSILLNDIALLYLAENISLDSQHAAIISLPKENIKTGASCQVVGWGRMYMNGPLANELLYSDLYLHSRKYCRKKFPNFSGTKICASNFYDVEQDACAGDSGGPLICSGVITGIVSYGYGCASGMAGIYTNVYKYLDWINNSAPLLLNPCLITIGVSLFLGAVLK